MAAAVDASTTLHAVHDWRPEAEQGCGEGTNMFGDTFRNYEDSVRQDVVSQTYRANHVNQTVAFVRDMHERWLHLNHGELTIMEAITMLDQLVDDSDPDNDLPNSIHDFQTAERIRKQWPEHDWFHLVGLLHDIGKLMALPSFAGEHVTPQWAVVGDTFPVGCAHSDACVFPEFFKENPAAYTPEFQRMWHYYLKICEALFDQHPPA